MRVPNDSPQAAFTRADLLAVVGVLALAGLLGLPLLAQPLRHSRTALCFENLRELMRASQAYAADHEDRLPPNPTDSNGNTNAWSGPHWLDLSASPNNTNLAATIMRGPLWPYMNGNAAAYRCPEDLTGFTGGNGGSQPRVRSYSMNSFMGNATGWINGASRWRAFPKFSDLPDPAGLWVFHDERPDSINDGMFAVDMSGFPDAPRLFVLVDAPSFYHSRGGAFGFGDGHVEHRIWRDSRTLRRYTGGSTSFNPSHPNNPDLAWLLARSSVPK